MWLLAAICAQQACAGEAVSVTREGDEAMLGLRNGLTHQSVRVKPSAGMAIGKIASCRAGTSNVVVVWEEIATNGSDADICAQMFSLDGAAQWGTNGIAVNRFRGRQQAPAVAVSIRGDVWVVWQSDSAKHNNIWCQRIRPDGRLAWAMPVAVCTAVGEQTQPAIAEDADGQMVIAWEDRRNGNSDIYGQRIDADGTPAGPQDGWAIETGPGDQTDVRLECDATGHARWIRWTDRRTTASAPVQVQTDLTRLSIPEPTLSLLALVFGYILLQRRHAAH